MELRFFKGQGWIVPLARDWTARDDWYKPYTPQEQIRMHYSTWN
jgi:hypothetical protein